MEEIFLMNTLDQMALSKNIMLLTENTFSISLLQVV